MRGRLGLTWMPSFLLQAPGKGALTHHPQAVGATACGSRAFDQGGPSGCAQLHGGAVTTSLLLCRANRKLPFFKSLMGAAPARFHFAGQASPGHGAVQRVWDTGPTNKNRFSAATPEVCFEHLWEQMHACKLGEDLLTRLECWPTLCYA